MSIIQQFVQLHLLRLTKMKIPVLIYSLPCQWKVEWSFVAHQSCTELYSKTALQPSPKQLKQRLVLNIFHTARLAKSKFSWSPQIQNLGIGKLFTPFWKPENLTIDAKCRVSVSMLWSGYKSLNKCLFKAIWELNSGLLRTWPHLLHLFRRMLHHCCALKLQKCFVEYETFHLHGGE